MGHSDKPENIESSSVTYVTHARWSMAIASFAQLQGDLRKDDDDTLQQLHEKVEQCASQCG